MVNYDVIVVGAGPAGSTAARYSALSGAKTLLLDKKINVGEPVRCGEFIPGSTELQKFFSAANQGIEELFNFPSPAGQEELITQKIEIVHLFSPSGKIYQFPLKGYTVERKKFDKYLVKEASKAGATVRTGEKVTGLEKNKVITEKETYSAKVIVGADGPSSLVAHCANLPLNDEYALCAQYVMDDLAIESEIMVMYSGKIAPGAYAWIIPKSKTSANVGVGIRKRFAGKLSLRGLLEYFINGFPYTKGKFLKGRIVSFVTGLVPTSGSFGPTVKDNVLLVGDAAGQVLPVTGGGIPTAMLCGRIAGRVAGKYVLGECELSDYEKLWRKELGKNFFSAWHKCRKFEWFLHWDLTLDLFLRFLGTKGIEKLIKLG